MILYELMTWSYRTVLGLGVGIVAVGLTLWGASQSGLSNQLLGQALSEPTPCQDQQVIEYEPPFAPAAPGPYNPDSIQPGRAIVHTLPCPALPAENQPAPAVGSAPEIFVSAPASADSAEQLFLCRFADTWWGRFLDRVTGLGCAVNVSAVPEPSIVPAPPITPSPTPVIKAPQSIWCPEEATSSPEHLWGAYCCREHLLNLIGSGTCTIGYSGNPTKAICESTLPNQALSTKMTTFGWSSSFFRCAEGAKKVAIEDAQGTIDVIKAKCPSGKTEVDCELVDVTRKGMFLACQAKVECTVTCDYTPRCNN